jgi:hypothetical protein
LVFQKKVGLEGFIPISDAPIGLRGLIYEATFKGRDFAAKIKIEAC